MRARHPRPWLTGIVMFALGALGLSPVAQAGDPGATSAVVGQPSRVGSYDNAAVADVMLSYVTKAGTNGVNVCLGTPYGSNFAGECKQTVNCAIYRASGGTQQPGDSSDYFGSFIAVGGVEVAQANAVKGDVIQWGSGTTGSQHTAVVVENQGGGNFRVVDSNFNKDHIVRDHVMNVNTFFTGYTPRFARMGTPMSPAPAVWADLVVGVPGSVGKVSYQFAVSRGDGTFGLGWAVGLTDIVKPVAVAMGDLNGDRRSDVFLAVPNAAGQVDYLYGLSLGDGRFRLGYTNLTNQVKPVSMSSGDINGA